MNRIRSVCILWLCSCSLASGLVFGQDAGDIFLKKAVDYPVFVKQTIRELYQDHVGFLWIGTTAGLYRYDGNELKAFTHDPADSTSISGNKIIEITEDENGWLWIGTDGSGLNRFNPKTQNFKRYWFEMDDALLVNTIWGILPYRDILWLGTRDGLVELNPDNQQVQRYRVIPFPQTPDERRQNMLRQIRPDPVEKNKLWITSLSGLHSFNSDNHTFNSYFTEQLKMLHPLDDEYDGQYMYSGMVYLQGSWILAAYGGGHYQYHTLKNTWRRDFYEPKSNTQPMKDNVVLQYKAIRDTSVFFTGSKTGMYFPSSGLSKMLSFGFDALGHPVEPESEGLVVDRKGFAWIGTNQGLFRTSVPVTSPQDDIVYHLFFSEVLVDEQRVAIQDNGEQNPLHLEPYQKHLHIRFTLIAPEDDVDITYRYRTGNDRAAWNESGINRSVQYEGWPSGRFSLEVQAVNASDGRVLAEQKLYCIASTYIWSRWWFIPLATFLFLGLAGALIWGRFRAMAAKLKLKTQYERALAQSEMTALRAQLNPHFLFNSLNSIKHYIIANEPRTATRYLNTFAKLMRLALDNSKNSFIPLSDEIEFIQLFLELEQVRMEEKLSYTLDIPSEEEMARIRIPPMLIQPYLENAIWHGIVNKAGKGLVSLRLRVNGDMLTIEILDDGIGRKASSLLHEQHKTRKSMGMKLIHDRLALLQKVYGTSASVDVTDLVDSSGNPCGTRVLIQLPLQYTQHETTAQSDHP